MFHKIHFYMYHKIVASKSASDVYINFNRIGKEGEIKRYYIMNMLDNILSIQREITGSFV